MAYSYSAIKEFNTCQRKYYENKVLKLHPHVDTQATMYGKEVHKALEDYIGQDIPLGGHSRFQGIADNLKNIEGTKHTELEMALDENLEPCAFRSDKAFIRGIADLVIINGTMASIFDYKTGKATYPDPEQLELMALMVFRHFPEVEHVKAALLFVLYDKIISSEYHKKNAKETWVKWAGKIAEIEQCHENNIWHENPSGLCGWCPCTTCPHHRERK
jgi:hypothetical protein